jgi:hypothetical protein
MRPVSSPIIAPEMRIIMQRHVVPTAAIFM